MEKFCVEVDPVTSEIVQKEAFEAGWSWNTGRKEIKHINKPYLFFYPDGYIAWGSSSDPEVPEYTVEEALEFFKTKGKKMKDFYVETKGDEDLNRLLQKKAFEAGFRWVSTLLPEPAHLKAYRLGFETDVKKISWNDGEQTWYERHGFHQYTIDEALKFFEQYKEFKAGDIVVFEYDKAPSHLRTETWDRGHILKITRVDSNVLVFDGSQNKNNGIQMSNNIKYFRHATPEEIRQYEEENRFKAGDWVKCIENKSDHAKGAGWQKDLVFRIERISQSTYHEDVFFGGFNGNGVYPQFLRKATPEEIAKAQEIRIGDYTVQFPGGEIIKVGCRHYSYVNFRGLLRYMRDMKVDAIQIEGHQVGIKVLEQIESKL